MLLRLKTKIILGFVLVCSFVAFARSGNPERNASGQVRSPMKIGNHAAIYDEHGTLLSWAPWKTVIAREMQWYLNCPVEHGYPRFMWMTFMDGNYQPRLDRPDFIPATQNGMGIISYLKYYEYDHRRNPKLMDWARLMGDYLVHECNTPDSVLHSCNTLSQSHPLHRHSREISPAGCLRHAGGSAFRNSAG
jgi:hypothetical protein